MLTVSYTPHSAASARTAGRRCVQKTEADGDVLVFLPEPGEIRRALRECEALARARNLLVAPLYGDLSPENRIAPCSRRIDEK